MPIQCKNCAGVVVFDPDLQKLTCRNCGGKYDVTHTDDTGFVDLQKVFDDRGKLESQDINVCVCSACGGRIVVDDVTITSECPFCGNKGIIFDRVSKRRRPDGVIPFAFGAKKAEEKARAHLMGSAFLSDKAKNMEFTRTVGISVPYYVISAEFKGILTYEQNAKKNDNPADREQVARSVRCLFDKLTLEASDALIDEAGFSLEPFDIKGIRTFEEGYLQGFCSDMADEDPKALYRKAKEICKEYITSETERKKIAPDGYHCIGFDKELKFMGKAVYALFPVWFVTGRYKKNRSVTILVNGQTGKAVGGPPYSKLRFALTVAAASILPVILLSALGILGISFVALCFAGRSPEYGGMAIAGLVTLASLIIAKATGKLSSVHKVLRMSSSERLIRFSGRRDK